LYLSTLFFTQSQYRLELQTKRKVKMIVIIEKDISIISYSRIMINSKFVKKDKKIIKKVINSVWIKILFLRIF